ncbi:cytochrome c biogenesis CcdA family protein [Pseudolysinimonas sp.]|uniref:cytochrome c biogenesis CcdA family protein n=1 Tax=Pseudolysinimonas sp. TaxID=2680009 RepID=UPI003F7F56CB
MGIGTIVTSGGLWLAVPIALAAGLVSFLSPCVLPLVPGYLGYVSGVASGAVQTRRRVLLGAALFVLGFSLVFLLATILVGTVGVFVAQWTDLILRIAGVVVIVMGVVFIGQVSFLQRTVKPAWQPRTGLIGAPLLGVIFAVGWTPCVGPTLVAVTSLVLDQGDLGRAVLLGVAYCLGLGIPFLLVAIGFGWVGASVRWVKRHIRAVNIAGGVLLIAIGVLMVSGVWGFVIHSIGAGTDVPL